MNIHEYKYCDGGGPGWSFSTIYPDKINLFVGDSATGKTRLLNTIFNLGIFIVRTPNEFKAGIWDITFEHRNILYKYSIASTIKNNTPLIEKETLAIIGNSREILVDRSPGNFLFKKEKLPKLQIDRPALSLLKEEDLIKPAYDAFCLILKRSFDSKDLDDQKQAAAVEPTFINTIHSPNDLYKKNVILGLKLWILKEKFKDSYKKIVSLFSEAFPFIEEIAVGDLCKFVPELTSSLPIYTLAIKEKNVQRWIPLQEFSSGMLKSLLILTDIFTLPDSSLYLIDEYENSLGISAINFFPTLMSMIREDIQIILTSHHPYIINNISVDWWHVFYRSGSTVTIRHGDEISKLYGNSSKNAFIKLINDPKFVVGNI